jgi:hypothetical protein
MSAGEKLIMYTLARLLLLTLLLSPGLFAQDSTVTLEPDHCFIFVSQGAPEANVLVEAGLRLDEGKVQSHGISWVSFTFENFYIELGWVHDEEVFQEDWHWWDEPWKYRPTWKTSGASPFLLAFHRADPANLGLPFRIAQEVNFYEDGGWVNHGKSKWPYLFVMGPREAMPDPWWMTPEIKEHAANHPSGMHRLTKMKVGTTLAPSHEALRVLRDQGALDSYLSSEHVLELTFDDNRQGKTYDARPDIPLIFHY